MLSINKSEKLNRFLLIIVLILFLLVSCVPFFALKHIKIMNLPIHYLIIGGSVSLLAVFTWFNQQKKADYFDKWLFALFIGLSLSLVTSIDRLYTLRSIASFFLRGIGVAFIASKLINTQQRKNLSATVLLSGACFVCLLGLIEFFSGQVPFFHHLYLKHAPYYPTAFSPRGGMVSTIGHPLPVGAYLVLLFPLSIWFFQNKKTFFKIIPVLLVSLTILLSFSRSSWIAGFCALIIFFSSRENFKIILKRWYYLLIFIIIFILPFFTFPRLRNTFNYRIQGIKFEIFSSHRSASYITTWNILKKYPVFGVGLGNYSKVHKIYRNEKASPFIETPDNMYLCLLSETGLVGTTTFFVFIIFVFKHLWRKKTIFSWAMSCGLIGFLINLIAADLFYWLAPQFLFWFLIGMNIAKDEN